MISSRPVSSFDDQVEVLSRVSSDPRVQISRSSDQSKFCSILRREVRRTVQKLKEGLSESRSVQSSPVKASLGFWPCPLRSTSCFSPRTLSFLGIVCRVLCRQQVRNPPRLGMFWGWTSVSSASYSAGSRKPLVRWIGKTQRDGIMAYG
ncbi:hypothetical protein YC2023_012304 [Brassica napus]